MSYAELYSLLKGVKNGNDVTRPLAMTNHVSMMDGNTVVSGTVGGQLQEYLKPLPSEDELDRLEGLKSRIQRGLDTLYGVTVPEIVTYGFIERNFGLGTADVNKYCYINATLPNILVYVARGYMPIIPLESDRREIYNKLVELDILYREDPSSLVQITLDESLSLAISMYKDHIEETYPSLFMQPVLEHGNVYEAGNVFGGLSDGLFTNGSRSLLRKRNNDILETARLADGSVESNFQGEDESFGTDALSAYFNK